MLIPLRHLLQRVLALTGHGELLILYGIVLAVGGADLFELVGMKGDLGALVIGMLLASHPKANELAKDLLGSYAPGLYALMALPLGVLLAAPFVRNPRHPDHEA